MIVNGHKKTIPSCYEEVSTRHYQQMVKEWIDDKPIAEKDYFKLFCILTDTNFKSFQASSVNEATIWNAIRWTVEQNFQFSDVFPKVLKIGDKLITLPKKVGALSIGQNIHLRQLLDKSKYVEENLSMATAIYLQPLIDNSKFDYDRAVEIEKEIAEMPAYLIRPVGFFLLTNALLSGRTRGINWLKTLNSHIRSIRRMLPTLPNGRGLFRMPTLG